jgi:predicted nicotinamide N-methyase
MEDRLRPRRSEVRGLPSPAFIRHNTEILLPPLIPEIRLHLASEAAPLWQKTEEELGELGLPPPFWAFAWAGGQALARYILDHCDIVRGRNVVDLASGSGLVAIAAAIAGARRVIAADIDGFASMAIGLNSRLNDVAIEIMNDDLLAKPPPCCNVILVGDLFYEKALAERACAWLKRAEAEGIDVLIGDPGRSYLPRDELERIAEYSVPVSRDLEDAEIKRSAVWRLRGSLNERSGGTGESPLVPA